MTTSPGTFSWRSHPGPKYHNIKNQRHSLLMISESAQVCVTSYMSYTTRVKNIYRGWYVQKWLTLTTTHIDSSKVHWFRRQHKIEALIQLSISTQVKCFYKSQAFQLRNLNHEMPTFNWIKLVASKWCAAQSAFVVTAKNNSIDQLWRLLQLQWPCWPQTSGIMANWGTPTLWMIFDCNYTNDKEGNWQIKLKWFYDTQPPRCYILLYWASLGRFEEMALYKEKRVAQVLTATLDKVQSYQISPKSWIICLMLKV